MAFKPKTATGGAGAARAGIDWILQVFPCAKFSNCNDVSSVNFVLLAQELWALTGSVSGANFQNLIFFKFGVRVIRTSWAWVSSLFIAVHTVILLRACKKMLRIAAWWIIALMKHAQTFWNWANKHLESYAMRVNPFPVAANNSISLAGGACPDPATIWAIFVNVFPEAILKCAPTSKCRTAAPFRWSGLSLTSASFAALLSHYSCRLAELVHWDIMRNRLSITI